MDQLILAEKLESLRRCISRIDEKRPKTMGDVFETLQKLNIISEKTCQQMKKAVGFRNVAIHNYATISWEIVYAISEKSLDDFRTFAKEINDGVTAIVSTK